MHKSNFENALNIKSKLAGSREPATIDTES